MKKRKVVFCIGSTKSVKCDCQPGSPSCAPFLCNGGSATCPQTCAADGDCIMGDVCNCNNICAPTQANGAIYSFVAPKAKAAKPPGEWNRMLIRCQGPLVVVELNGVEVQRASMDDHPEQGKGELPLSKRPRKGLIGLQSHGDRVDFRSIEVREL